MSEILNPSSFNVDVSVYLIMECVIRILLSFVSGIVLGLERKFRQQVVGMRTLTLISVSSCLLGILSFYVIDVAGSGDHARISAAVVNGIGFLGAGAILRQGLNIKGLTSAAIIWTSCAIGLSFGAGLYVPALIVLGVSVLTLLFLEKVEEKWFPAGKSKTLSVTFNQEAVDVQAVKRIIEQNGFIIADFNISRIIEDETTILSFNLKSPKFDEFEKIVEELKALGKLAEFTITD